MQFQIYALDAGGGTLGLSPMPGRFDLLENDIAAINDWGAGLVLTMVGSAELSGEGAADLGPRLAKQGINWIHLPMTDFGTPDAEIAARWPEASATARATLSAGGKVLAHCYGGCGRSGMIALRLMVELGESGEAALKRLRTVRPCAVETEDQRRWAIKEG